jgi:pimeloyl-[acyl-carrier protein] synthase
MDVVAALARPLPVTVISEMMGLPAEDRPMLAEWSDGLIAAMDVAPSAQALAAGNEAAHNFRRYFQARLEACRRERGDDSISRLLAAQDRDDLLTDDDIVANATLLFFTGHETTTSLISSATRLLLTHPEQLDKLRAQPALLDNAIEECLRYEPPLQWFGRMAVEDLMLGGRQICKGDTVYVLIGAVNRDPQQFPDPERFDITRAQNVHRTFGHGIHACLGQSLARVEGSIAIGRLLRRFPNLRLESATAECKPLVDFRGLRSLGAGLQ